MKLYNWWYWKLLKISSIFRFKGGTNMRMASVIKYWCICATAPGLTRNRADRQTESGGITTSRDSADPTYHVFVWFSTIFSPALINAAVEDKAEEATDNDTVWSRYWSLIMVQTWYIWSRYRALILSSSVTSVCQWSRSELGGPLITRTT